MFGVSGVLVQLTGDTLRWLRLTCRSTQSLEAGNNDLALGRIVQALSHSPYWKDTVIFVVEDDAQAGPDHTDSHRAPFYAISAYNRPGTAHRFINTTDVIAAIEDILGMGRLSKLFWRFKSRPGRPPIPARIQALIRRIANENPLWSEERALRQRPSAALPMYRPQTSISPPRKACAWHGIACTLWQSAFAPTVAAAARSATEMRLGNLLGRQSGQLLVG